LDSTLKGMGFGQSPHEEAIYRQGNGGNVLLVGVYVDDLLITGTKDTEVAAFKEEMKATFQMSDMVLLSFYLGIEVHQGDPRRRRPYCLCQQEAWPMGWAYLTQEEVQRTIEPNTLTLCTGLK
jgi:hypothetical protein